MTVSEILYFSLAILVFGIGCTVEPAFASGIHGGSASERKPPHILYILADDWGWRYSDWHRKDLVNQTLTPTLQGLVNVGIELDRLYAFKYCSPSRKCVQQYCVQKQPIHLARTVGKLSSHIPRFVAFSTKKSLFESDSRFGYPNGTQSDFCERTKCQARSVQSKCGVWSPVGFAPACHRQPARRASVCSCPLGVR